MSIGSTDSTVPRSRLHQCVPSSPVHSRATCTRWTIKPSRILCFVWQRSLVKHKMSQKITFWSVLALVRLIQVQQAF